MIFFEKYLNSSSLEEDGSSGNIYKDDYSYKDINNSRVVQLNSEIYYGEEDKGNIKGQVPDKNVKDINKENKEKIFFVEHTQVNSKEIQNSNAGENKSGREVKKKVFLLGKRKRSGEPQKKFESVFEMIKSIKINFTNTFMINDINDKLEKEYFNSFMVDGINDKLEKEFSKLKFKKFHPGFTKNVRKDINKKMLNMKLKDIFSDLELYKVQKTKNYIHNLKIINELGDDSKLLKYLNEKTYSEAYEDYLKSVDYQNHIEKIKTKHKDDFEYHERFISLANGFLNYFSQEKDL